MSLRQCLISQSKPLRCKRCSIHIRQQKGKNIQIVGDFNEALLSPFVFCFNVKSSLRDFSKSNIIIHILNLIYFNIHVSFSFFNLATLCSVRLYIILFISVYDVDKRLWKSFDNILKIIKMLNIVSVSVDVIGREMNPDQKFCKVFIIIIN